jgi:6-phosphogluconate dehydrogenase
MDLGMVGLGKMGANMTARLVKSGHRVVATDRDEEARNAASAAGAEIKRTLDKLVAALEKPRAVWVMVPSGDPTEGVVRELAELLEEGDTVIDGGNSDYKDSMRRAGEVAKKGIGFVDVGTSGGVWGLTEGYSMMVGGQEEAVARVRPALESLAPGTDKGWGHVGPSGAGHFTKMVHNGIEYGLMEAYAEGFDILKKKEEFPLDLHQVAEIWRYGSVVRSWLLELIGRALEEDQELSGIRGWVADSGEGRWTVQEALDLDVPAPAITLSLLMRFVSRQEESYAAKLLAAMRHQFGGHAVKKAESSS